MIRILFMVLTSATKGETPGLGAEISKPAFSNEFKGKKIFMSGEFKSVAVVKPGKSVAGHGIM